MNIPASNFMSASTIVQNGAEQNTVTRNNTFAARVAGVKNAPEVLASAGSSFLAITGFARKVADASGLTKLASGLVSVGNVMGRVFGISGKAASILPLFSAGIKIAQYGVQKLLYEVLSLMKEQALPIIDSWLSRIIEDGGHMTPFEVFSSLITAIRDNDKLKMLFHNVVTA